MTSSSETATHGGRRQRRRRRATTSTVAPGSGTGRMVTHGDDDRSRNARA